MASLPLHKPEREFPAKPPTGARVAILCLAWALASPMACSLMVADELSDKPEVGSDGGPGGGVGGDGGTSGTFDSGYEDEKASGGSSADAGAAGAGGMGDSSAGGTDAGDPDALACGADPKPAASSVCPVECDDCDFTDGVCIFDCPGQQSCKERIMTCPVGWRCAVGCAGTQSCEKAELACPDHFACSVSCTGNQACKDLVIACSSGPCTLACHDNLQACEGTNVECGTDLCHVSPCPTDKLPVVQCNGSCDCVSCS